MRITLTGSKITNATAVQYPDETARSKDINSTAVPKLNQETLAAQSAAIDTVSGATYTSAGYKQSLQSALDQAGV
ncbi:FMN-binding protein [Streptomyces sp. NBC_00996]|uniref:FMN-binding protein n=1 Tax=Streptomyces sp. NBC_00996 TaxID=2903710 RepID=UPI00386A10AE|nr:FMN-binding protein [Streptomyces sp. NBC_00996]